MSAGGTVSMAVKTMTKDRVAEVRLGLRLSEEILAGLAAWARTEGRSTEAQGRLLIEHAVAARIDRLGITRR